MSQLMFLLLEDSLLDVELIQALIAEGGITCDIIQAKTDQEFEIALSQNHVDLILADYSLPGFDGIAALEIAQRISPNVPFIFVTATMGEEVAIETLKSGATDYVLKQRLERLIPSIQRALCEAEERRARQNAEIKMREQKEELEKLNRIKDEFLAVLSHELRSPLNAILGWSKILRTRQVDAATLQRALETIERNAKLQTQLIEDLLDISRIIGGKLTLCPQETDLIPAIEAAIDTMRLAAQAKSLDVIFSISDRQTPTVGKNSQTKTTNISPFLVLGDPNRLQQILWNLLSNAIKFTPPHGKVEVILEQINTEDTVNLHSIAPSESHSLYALITIKDTGIGIRENFIPHIFDSFRQADGSTTRKYGGLGLGLAIVRQLVELHGGKVTASSCGENQGATFTVTIPLLQSSAAEILNTEANNDDIVADSAHAPLTGWRILVVDDDTDSREFLEFAFLQAGAKTATADSVSAAINTFSSFQPHILVSDIGMPQEDGYSLIRQIRSLTPQQGGKIPAIAITAYASEDDKNAAIAAGFQSHMAKPILPDELVSTVQDLLGIIER
ncbi:PAS/PAC sensor hybrid histidine kinase [Calothrix sp. NIES-4101]|nr:PAS/PAC sensor hybrid histidine kinase [Calothrix sp. NIES-4101]